MAFLNPLLLWGGAAVAAPILIHMLMRRHVVPVRWAAMKLLRESVQRTQKRLRVEDLLLLLLRCLLVLLAAFALARPAFLGGGAGAMASGAETAVIVLDNSYSMATTDGSHTRFEKAQAAAEGVIDGFASESRVALLFMSDVVDPAIAEPGKDLNLARKLVRDARVVDRGTDCAPAVRRAVEILKRFAGRRSIYFISDGQAVGWSGVASAAEALREADGIAFVPVLAGEIETQNTAITAVRLASAMAPVQQAVRFDVEVANFGEEDARNIPVSLAVDENAPGDEATIDSIPPGGSKSVSLYGRFDEPGSHAVTAATAPDRLPADDSAVFALRAIKDAPILLVNGEGGGEAREDETFFLSNALAPVASSAREEFYLKPEVIDASALETTVLGEYDAVILANVTDMSEAVSRSLQNYVSRGGGVIIFLGDRANARYYNETLQGKLGLLPAKLGEVREDKAGVQFSPAPYEHPILSIWNDPAAGTLASARIYKRFDLTTEGPDAVTVLAYRGGRPAIVEKQHGAGRVILVSTAGDTEWSDLPVRPAFVPLFHRMVGSLLALKGEDLNITVGGEALVKLPPAQLDRDVRITLPGGGDTRVRRVTLLEGRPILRFDETERAGEYVGRTEGASPFVVRFAVQANRAESNLRPAEPEVFASLTGGAAPLPVDANFAEQMHSARAGAEIWFPVLLGVLALAAMESVLADRFSRAK